MTEFKLIKKPPYNKSPKKKIQLAQFNKRNTWQE